MMKTEEHEKKKILGWREWVSIPDIGIPAIKAKVDTGAKTSALHAFSVEPFKHQGTEMVRFLVHPLQKRIDIVLVCEAPIVDQRIVTDSGGHREMRYVIETSIVLGGETVQTEMTLTDRDTMQFRMLLGRRTMSGRFTVDPEASYLMGRMSPKLYSREK